MEENKIKSLVIGDKVYQIKITLGFWKMLSFSKEELNTINSNATRLFEAVKLAIYFGNEEACGWDSLADMEKVITDKALERLDDPDLTEKLSEAIFDSYPKALQDALKNAVKEMQDSSEEVKKK